MIELSPAGRRGIPDEVGAVGALLMGARRRIHHRQRYEMTETDTMQVTTISNLAAADGSNLGN